MMEIIQSQTFLKWVDRLPDQRARTIILARLMRLGSGLSGDTRAIWGGIYELRIHYEPGYRVYYIHEGMAVVVLLCGGDKTSQSRDVLRAKRLAEQWRKTHG